MGVRKNPLSSRQPLPRAVNHPTPRVEKPPKFKNLQLKIPPPSLSWFLIHQKLNNKKNLSLPLSSPLPLYTLILSLPLSPLSPASEIKKKIQN